MHPQVLLERVEAEFPLINRPPGDTALLHAGDCAQCNALRDSLQGATSPELPLAALRGIYDQVDHLSAAGWRWVLPSYMTHCLHLARSQTLLDTEFLTFNLGASMHGLAESAERLSAFTQGQKKCLVLFLRWCAEHEDWVDYCGEDIDSALAALAAA